MRSATVFCIGFNDVNDVRHDDVHRHVRHAVLLFRLFHHHGAEAVWHDAGAQAWDCVHDVWAVQAELAVWDPDAMRGVWAVWGRDHPNTRWSSNNTSHYSRGPNIRYTSRRSMWERPQAGVGAEAAEEEQPRRERAAAEVAE